MYNYVYLSYQPFLPYFVMLNYKGENIWIPDCCFVLYLYKCKAEITGLFKYPRQYSIVFKIQTPVHFA